MNLYVIIYLLRTNSKLSNYFEFYQDFKPFPLINYPMNFQNNYLYLDCLVIEFLCLKHFS